jgi:hypothetical protein
MRVCSSWRRIVLLSGVRFISNVPTMRDLANSLPEARRKSARINGYWWLLYDRYISLNTFAIYCQWEFQSLYPRLYTGSWIDIEELSIWWSASLAMCALRYIADDFNLLTCLFAANMSHVDFKIETQRLEGRQNPCAKYIGDILSDGFISTCR